METIEPKLTETVSETKPKKTRKFTWTDKRKAQFEKMLSSNKRKSKKSEGSEKTTEESKTEAVEDPAVLKETKEEKQSQNIVKRIMDPHYLARKDRHMIGTTSDRDSESESEDGSSDDDSEESDNTDFIETVKKIEKKPVMVKKDWKLKRKVDKLRTKNKQLQDLFLNKLNKSKKRNKTKFISDSEEDSVEDHEQEQPNYSSSQIKPPPSLYFC